MPWIVDIASVANAHINALERPNANGRYIIANAPLDFQQVSRQLVDEYIQQGRTLIRSWDQVVDILYDNFGDSDWISNVPRGKPGTRQLGDFFTLDNTRSRMDLGIEYGDIRQAVIDFANQYQEERKTFV